MEQIGVDPVGMRIMAPKLIHLNLKVSGLTNVQANIIKQEMLAAGGEAAISRGVISCKDKITDAVLSGTCLQFERVADKLKLQPFGMADIGKSIGKAISNIMEDEIPLVARSRKWMLGGRTMVMGILNVSPDSFSDGGLYMDRERAVERGLWMVERGADIIDVGGESTRPGALPVPLEEELRRVMPVVDALVKRGVVVSVDTTKAGVARPALDAGVEMINDVSALRFDPDMADVCAEYGPAVVLMHMRGSPLTMQRDVAYRDLMADVFDFLEERLEFAAKRGISPEKTAIDPGIGFGKSVDGNNRLIRNLAGFSSLGRPIVIGTSRKSFIREILGVDIEETMMGTAATVAASILAGAHIVRVHDAPEMKMVSGMVDALRGC